MFSSFSLSFSLFSLSLSFLLVLGYFVYFLYPSFKYSLILHWKRGIGTIGKVIFFFLIKRFILLFSSFCRTWENNNKREEDGREGRRGEKRAAHTLFKFLLHLSYEKNL